MTHWKLAALCLLAAALILAPATATAQSTAPEVVWYDRGPDGEAQLHLYFFWSKTCPHCQEARPFVEALPGELPWLQLHSLELTEHPENAQQYAAMAMSLGQEAMYVPAFFFCNYMATGYGTADTTGKALVDALTACRAEAQQRLDAEVAPAVGPVAATAEPASAPAGSREEGVPAPLAATDNAAANAAGSAARAPVLAAGPAVPDLSADTEAPEVNIPFVGSISAASLSLPVFTAVLAGLDAFNPCAFFVLLFLLSLMVHARDRRRMLLIGGIFVFFSGLIYFVFMSAWLNVFLWVGELKTITLVAGLVAIGIALINIKDYFWYKQGVSLSIPESAKPGLYQRTRSIIQAGSLPAMVASTALLAIAANSYELLCTAGFPMVYTRVLTLSDLAPGAYYGYLAAYNIIYVLPLLAIVGIFSAKFGSRKLTEQEGRVLKLLSGTMMLLLGAVLVFAPELLNQVWTAVLLLGAAVAVTAVIVLVDRRLHHRAPPPATHGKLRPRHHGRS
jgi:hypothetical protein